MASLEQLLSDLTSGDDARAEAAVPALTVHGRDAIQALSDLQDSPIVDRRWWATRSLSSFPQPEARQRLIKALSDADVTVRQCAALGLKHQPTDEAVDILISQLDQDDQLLARLASDALAEIGVSAITRLSQASQHPNPKVRIQAVRALALMEKPEAIGPLFECIDDPSSIVTHWVEQGLDRMGIGMSFFNPS